MEIDKLNLPPMRFKEAADMALKWKKAVVVGANGIIGGNLIAHLVELGDWDIVGLSRRGIGDSVSVLRQPDRRCQFRHGPGGGRQSRVGGGDYRDHHVDGGGHH